MWATRNSLAKADEMPASGGGVGVAAGIGDGDGWGGGDHADGDGDGAASGTGTAVAVAGCVVDAGGARRSITQATTEPAVIAATARAILTSYASMRLAYLASRLRQP